MLKRENLIFYSSDIIIGKIFLALIIINQISCNSEGHGAISNSINESKNRDVYVSEYEIRPNPLVINDTLKIKINTAWVENQWAYGKSNDNTLIIKDKFQLVIDVDFGTLKNYGSTWRIGINGSRYFRSCGSNCLISDFNQLPNDIEEWEVQKGRRLDSLSKKIIIGKFKMFKKFH